MSTGTSRCPDDDAAGHGPETSSDQA